MATEFYSINIGTFNGLVRTGKDYNYKYGAAGVVLGFNKVTDGYRHGGFSIERRVDEGGVAGVFAYTIRVWVYGTDKFHRDASYGG